MNRAISTLVSRYRKYCEEIPTAALAPAATAEEVAERRSIRAGSRRVTLDEAYLELARAVDGLAADGAQLYPLVSRIVTNRRGELIDRMDVATANQHWREVYDASPVIEDFLIYGRDDTAFFIRHLQSGRFQHRGRAGLSFVFFDCETFEKCIWEAFRYAFALGDFDSSQRD